MLLNEKRVTLEGTEIQGIVDKNRHGDKGMVQFILKEKPVPVRRRPLMLKLCAQCGQRIKEGQLVTLNILVEWKELKSDVIYSVSQPLDADPYSIKHMDCNEPDETSN